MEKEETNNNANGMMPWNNAFGGWGNMSWGAMPYWNQQKQGPSGTDIAALILGIAGTGLGLMSGGLGLFNNRNGFGPNGGPNGGPNIQDRLAALEAQVAVNTAHDVDAKELTAALIKNAEQASKIAILESEAKTNALITAVNNQVIVNAGTLACVKGKVDDLTQIGIPQANIIPTPTAAAASTNG